MFSKILTNGSIQNFSDKIEQLKKALDNADAIVIGAGAGLSTSAGFTYSGERFDQYFFDFKAKYPFRDMYSGGFYPYQTEEEFWAYWSRYIYINRYTPPTKSVYDDLFHLVCNKDYFVLTTNVDHCFQRSGFDKHRLFYTQGDYGLFQCSEPCHHKTYDNHNIIKKMVLSQGFEIDENGSLDLPDGTIPKMTVPTELVPHCPVCGKPMSMNLRADDTFVEDEGWHQTAERYEEFLRRHQNLSIVFLELGVGGNTPAIIKYPFLRMTLHNPKATYICINQGEAFTLSKLSDRSICFNDDIGKIISLTNQ